MKKQIHGERWWVVWFSTIQLFRWIPFRNRHPISRASIFPPPSRVPYRFLQVQRPELQWIVGTEVEKNRTSLILRLTLSLGSTPLAQLPSSRLLSEPKYDKNSRIVWYNLFGYREKREFFNFMHVFVAFKAKLCYSSFGMSSVFFSSFVFPLSFLGFRTGNIMWFKV